MSRAGRLSAAGTAGDWGAARRALKESGGAGTYDVSQDSGDPPEFVLDPRSDLLQRLLALYTRPVPIERWRELSDVPAPLLPLAGLAASGVGAAVAVTHRRRLTGLLVVARRGDDARYSDDELSVLQELAEQFGRLLADALPDQSH